MQNFDSTDMKLLDELQTDCKQSIKQLAEKINLSMTPTHERIKKLESSGIIENYTAVVNPSLLGRKLTVYFRVTLAKHQEDYFKKFEEFVWTLDEVVEMTYLTGHSDYMLKVVLRDMLDFEEFTKRKISRLDIISNIQSSFVISQKNKNIPTISKSD